jgi:hypothetical protein
MHLRSVFGWLCLWLTLGMTPGWVNDLAAVDKPERPPAATAARDKAEETGRDVGGVQQKGEAHEEHQPGSKEEAEENECPPTFGPIITDTAVPLDQGKFNVQPTFGLGFVKNDLTKSWRRVSPGGNFKTFGMDWKFTYGLIKNVEIFVVVPYVNNWANSVKETGLNGERSASFGGLGDVSLTIKYQVLEEGPTNPAVTALFATGFPTGHFRHLNPGRLDTDILGGGAYTFTTGLNSSKCLKPFVVYANLWYTTQTAYSTREDFAGIAHDKDGNLVESAPASTLMRNYPRDYVTLNLAAEYIITAKWIALLELTSTWDAGRLIGHQANVPPAALLSIVPGIEYMATDKFSLALGVQVDLVGKNTGANVTPLLSMTYAF